MQRKILRSSILIACAFGTVVSSRAVADGTTTQATLLPDASIVVHESNGKSTVIPIDEKVAQALLSDSEAKPLDANIIVFKANNNTYMVRDHVMPSGEMMVASILRHYVPPQGGGLRPDKPSLWYLADRKVSQGQSLFGLQPWSDSLFLSAGPLR